MKQIVPTFTDFLNEGQVEKFTNLQISKVDDFIDNLKDKELGDLYTLIFLRDGFDDGLTSKEMKKSLYDYWENPSLFKSLG